MEGGMNRFSENEIEFFKRLKKTGKNVDSEVLKFSIVIMFIFATLILLPLINIVN